MSAVVGLSDYYHSVLSEREATTQLQSRNATTVAITTNTTDQYDREKIGQKQEETIMKVTDNEVSRNVDRGQNEKHIEMPIVYVSNIFNMSNQPKAVLNDWCSKEHLTLPVWTTYPIGKHFHTIVKFQGKTFASSYLQKCKRYSEHSAALVALISLDRYPYMDLAKKCIVKSIDKTKTMEVIFNHKRLMVKIK